MSHLPNHSYFGQYYFNPQWVETAGGSSPSVVYNNVVNFTVGPDGTHYFHQTYSGQFVAPSGPTVDMKINAASPSYDETVKPQTGKASGSGSQGNKEPGGQIRQKRQGDKETSQEAEVQDKYSSDEEDVWATEDEDYYGNDSDSSQDESNDSRSRVHTRERRRRIHSKRDDSSRSPQRVTDARSTIVSLVPREFQSF